ACHSRCSVIHPIGDHNHRSYFLQNQKPVIRMERSTDFFRVNGTAAERERVSGNGKAKSGFWINGKLQN
ncbi:MAG: hypothetical protein P8179_14090, partial [Candidatus Thiodiazotropha sp.]